MPRVVAPTVLALIALAFVGVLRRASRRDTLGAPAIHDVTRAARAAAAPTASGHATGDDVAASSGKDWTAWGGTTAR
jgi:hypothetical protein